LVENHLILLSDFLCPVCNVTYPLGVPALHSFKDFFDVETRLIVQKNFIFANKAKLPIYYVKVGKYQWLVPCISGYGQRYFNFNDLELENL